jgi:hypothetical protein
MIHYSYDFIENLANNFNATLDEDVANRLLDIKKGNKLIYKTKRAIYTELKKGQVQKLGSNELSK